MLVVCIPLGRRGVSDREFVYVHGALWDVLSQASGSLELCANCPVISNERYNFQPRGFQKNPGSEEPPPEPTRHDRSMKYRSSILPRPMGHNAEEPPPEPPRIDRCMKYRSSIPPSPMGHNAEAQPLEPPRLDRSMKYRSPIPPSPMSHNAEKPPPEHPRLDRRMKYRSSIPPSPTVTVRRNHPLSPLGTTGP